MCQRFCRDPSDGSRRPPRRNRLGQARRPPAWLWVAGLAAGAVACGGENPIATSCVLEQHALIGTPLTLLRDARLDAIGDAFVLLGSDPSGSTVRWVRLSRTGSTGAEHEIDVPEHVAGPWFAVAGSAAPMDRLIVAYVAPGAPVTGMADLMTFTVQFDGTLPTLPTVAGPIAVGAGARVTMASGREGMHAGIAWGTTGSTSLAARILDGDGKPVGADLALGTVNAFDCLRFLPGKGDLTIGYVDQSGTPPMPVFQATEITPAGTPQTPFRVHVGKELPECIEMTPADTGYGIAWHTEGIGFSFGVFQPTEASFPSRMFLGDIRFLPAKAPPLGGVGWMGKHYAIGFARPGGAEVRLVDAMANDAGKLPVFPSASGHTGTLSTQPVGMALYGTYADYPSATSTTTGQRFLVGVTCP